MTHAHDLLIGRPVSQVPTPALIVDIEALDHNLRLMSGFFAGRRAKLRPHFKSHKCVTIAKRQLEAGNAVGITIEHNRRYRDFRLFG